MKLLITRRGRDDRKNVSKHSLLKTDVGIQTEETAYPGQDIHHEDFITPKSLSTASHHNNNSACSY